MIKLDLHTHSEASVDGGIRPEEYAEVLKNEVLDVIAITDHNRIDFAKGLQKALGAERIIVGEEITCKEGEIVGLFLSEAIESGMSTQDTIDAIRAQDGLVYIPHPLESVRKGLSQEMLEAVAGDIDIIEAANGRAFMQNKGPEVTAWARQKQIPTAASSDAHGRKGLGYTYTIITNRPTVDTLTKELLSGRMIYKKAPMRSYLYPKYNRFKNTLKGIK